MLTQNRLLVELSSISHGLQSLKASLRDGRSDVGAVTQADLFALTIYLTTLPFAYKHKSAAGQMQACVCVCLWFCSGRVGPDGRQLGASVSALPGSGAISDFIAGVFH